MRLKSKCAVPPVALFIKASSLFPSKASDTSKASEEKNEVIKKLIALAKVGGVCKVAVVEALDEFDVAIEDVEEKDFPPWLFAMLEERRERQRKKRLTH